MDIEIQPQALRGTVEAVSSKSDVHRALICAALSDRKTEISCNLMSKDIEATARCLNAAGAGIVYEKAAGKLLVSPVGSSAREGMRGDDREEELFCGESGSTLRFLIPVMAALGKPVCFTGAGELPNRPLSALLSVLSAHGMEFDGEKLPLRMRGRLEPGVYRLPGNISSQYITGLLLAFPLMEGASEIRLLTELQSAAYVDMTLDTMSRFGINIDRTENGFYYTSGTYRSPEQYAADGDWSNAAFWLCADHLPGNALDVRGLRGLSVQGDRAVAEILKKHFHKEHAENTRTIDVSEIPDLTPALAALAVCTPGTTEFVNAERLRIKECDRISALHELAEALGAGASETASSLIIHGNARPEGGCSIDSHNDHRIAMAAAIAASACRNNVIIRGAQAVEKSYPHFFEDYRKLGGKADVI
ncbi:MAG: 3-phosphoshikimate 1-carboxyvinyltransferase [Eubacteriales bacterium]|nr:3-phosphoshikimate 1-carboxyvinyltransferase [Eubacteriales bacterium]